MKKGIVLVANLKSQWYCENLIYSIRKSGCQLPIRLIHFGGEPVNSKFILAEVEFLTVDDFSEEAIAFITNLRSVLTDCPMGFLYRFLAWFSDWEEFIYSDNDVVALINWELLFDYTEDYDLVHADEEYTTQGIFNYNQPQQLETIFGEGVLNTAMTAGHILVKSNEKMRVDMMLAVSWFKEHPQIPIKHDQSFLHVSALIGGWKLLNLCKPPHNWLSSWSEDYKNNLDLIYAILGGDERKTDSFKVWFSNLSEENQNRYNQQSSLQKNKVIISHLHYSGRGRIGAKAIDDLMFSSQTNEDRMMRFLKIQISDLFYLTHLKADIKRVKKYLNF